MQTFSILALAAISTLVAAVPSSDSCTIQCGDCVGIDGCPAGAAAHFSIASGLGTVCNGEKCILGTDLVDLTDGEVKVETRDNHNHCDVKCGGCVGIAGCPSTSASFFSITNSGTTCNGQQCILGTDFIKLSDGEIEVQTRDVDASVDGNGVDASASVDGVDAGVSTRDVEASVNTSGDNCSVKCGDCVGISMLCGGSANIDIINGLATCGGEHCTMSVPTTVSVGGVTVTL